MRAHRFVFWMVFTAALFIVEGVRCAWVDGANPVFAPSGGAYYPSVVYDKDSFSGHGAAVPYKMWYASNGGSAIGLARSEDGLSWTVEINPVVGLKPNGYHCQVLYDAGGFGGSGDYYRIWYWDSTQPYSAGINEIRTASSMDGITWVGDQAISQVGATVITGTCPGSPCPWNYGSYGPIAMIYNTSGSATLDDANIFNNRFVMYYNGTTGGQEGWGLAYSIDGLLWKGYNGGTAPVLPAGGTGQWDATHASNGSVIRSLGGTWDLWYGGGNGNSYQGIGHATSPDGIVWTRDTANPLTDLGCASPPSGLGCAGAWNVTRNYTPVVLARPLGSDCAAPALRMWRTGANAGGTKSLGTASFSATVRRVPSEHPTIQAAINAALPGDTVQVAAGTYAENLVIDRPLELAGAGEGSTTIVPAASDPDCAGAGGSDPLCPGASHIVLVQADCVTIRDLTLDGDNPGLTSGVIRGGADLDARNGIILNFPLGPFDHLTVHHATVKNVYLRGIYAYNPAKGAIDFHHNTVDNVQGHSYYSIGIFSRYATGNVSDNTVSRCPDAISANWSHGLQFLRNTVTASGSGVHTDNAGSDDGDPSDLLEGNQVSTGVAFGGDPIYGVWAFNPYIPVTIRDNTVSGADIGLAAHRRAAPAGMVAFSGNSVNGSARSGSRCALVSTDGLSWGSGDASATFSGDSLRFGATGLSVDQSAGASAAAQVSGAVITNNATGVLVNGGTATVTLSDLSADTAYGVNNAGGTATATCNWWGSASGPTHSGNPGGTGSAASDGVTYDPWNTTDRSGICDGCISKPATPTVTPPGPVGICGAGPVSVLLTASATTGTYQWFKDGAPVAGATSPTYTATAAGSYAVKVTEAGCASPASAAVAISVVASPPSITYVDDSYTGLPAGTMVDWPYTGSGSRLIGCDAYATIQGGINAVSSGGTVNVAAGLYPESVAVNRPMLVHGVGMDLVTLRGPKADGIANTLAFASGGVTVEGLTITRDGNTVADWPTNVKSQGVIFNPGVSGSTLRTCRVTGNRNGVYLNTAQGNTIRNNIITFNRTGIHLVNNVTGTLVTENEITDNWTVGVLFNTVFPGESSATAALTVSNNKIAGNWYGEVQCRWTLSPATLDVSGNWLGTADVTTNTTPPSEPGYLAQIPVVYGGTATNPGGAPTIGGATLDRIDYTPWLNTGTDTAPGTAGFQGDFSYLNVSALSPQTGAPGRIQEAVGLLDGAAPSRTVRALPGTYVENVVLDKSLTLFGTDRAATIIQPALSGPNPCPGASLCPGASSVLLVQASNVTIHDLTVDGDNPTLTSGIVREGADLDARNGIITNHQAGSFTALEVHHVTVRNIYLRGMYASSGGTFNFHDNAVDNVQGDGYSIGIFAWYGPGVMAGNAVSRCNDAVSANHSSGIQFLNNIVTHSGSGVHTDNSGDGGGAADLIRGNTVSDCTSGGYGIWTFVPYLAPTVEENMISNCDVGLSAWGQGAPVIPLFRRNTVTGSGVVHSVGAYITTDLIGWGYSDVSVRFEENAIAGFETGIYLTADPQLWNPEPWVSHAVAAVFYDNSLAGNLDLGTQGTYACDASANWWGTNDPAVVKTLVNGGAIADYTPWFHAGTDTGADPGFQGDFSYLHVDDDSPQTGTKGRVQEGIDRVSGSTVQVEAGIYPEPVDIVGRTDVTVLGADRDASILKPTATLSWAIPGYPQYDGRRSPVRVVGSSGIVFRGLTFDFDLVKGNNVIGILYWDTPGTLDGNLLKNMSAPDASGYYSELVSYFRAPAYAPDARAEVALTGNEFLETGRVAVVTHDSVHATITGNTFTKTVDDFGYALEIGSTSTALIRQNAFAGYRTPATDHSQSGAIYIENAFTNAIIDPVAKPVRVESNTITGCQWGVYVGNEFDGYAGNVDIQVTLTGNTVQNASIAPAPYPGDPLGGIFITDEDRAQGSSVTVTGGGNRLLNNGPFGYFIGGWGDADITVALAGETVTGHARGIHAEGPLAGSAFNLAVTRSDLSGNSLFGVENAIAGATFDARCDWWGTPTGPTHSGNPGGTGSPSSNGVSYSPWAGTNTFDCAVKYAVPTRLVYTQQPTDTVVDTAIAPAVAFRAEDDAGNLGYNFHGALGAVTMGIGDNPAGGVLSGTVARQADHGLLAFDDLAIDAAGTGYSLIGTAGAPWAFAPESAPFNILLPLGEVIELRMNRDGTDPARVDLRFTDVGNYNYNIYVSSSPVTHPFDVAVAGRKDCAVAGVTLASPGWREKTGYDPVQAAETLYFLVTADFGKANSEGPLGVDSGGASRSASAYCRRP